MFPEDIPSKKSEPEMHPSIKKSFLFMPTAGMRIAPELLVLELSRELFYEEFCGSSTARQLDPEERNVADDEKAGFNNAEKGALYACRVSKRQFSQTKVDAYFSPAYPALARNAWLRKQSDRVIRDFLFVALSQKLNAGGNGSKDKKLEVEFRKTLFDALVGNRSVQANNFNGKDILSAACSMGKDDETIMGDYKGVFEERMNSLLTDDSLIDSIGEDPLANRITIDFLNICKLEKELPRLQWLEILKAFLRLSIPIWILSHARTTCLVRDWLCDALSDGALPSSEKISSAISSRYEGLILPSITPTNNIAIQIENYMRARIELNAMLYGIDELSASSLKGRSITVLSKGAGVIPITDLLQLARKMKADFRKHCALDKDDNLRVHLTRRCERYVAWKNPLKKGTQGSNFDEFLRVLRKAHVGDDEGSFLLTPSKATGGQYFTVFPGFMMLKLVTYLASMSIKNGSYQQLLLSDVEAHFLEYGIDFSASEGARPMLLQSLQEIGILKGSPDAGENVEIIPPYVVHQRSNA